MTRKDIALKWAAYLVALAVTALFNYNILGLLPISLPLLIPMAAVSVGILEGPRFGGAFGIVAGLALSVIGHKTLLAIPLLTLVGWLCGLLARHALRRDLVGNTLCAAGVLVILECWQVGIRILRHVAAPALLVRVALPELLWTVLFSVPVYWVCRFCCVHYGRIYHE